MSRTKDTWLQEEHDIAVSTTTIRDIAVQEAEYIQAQQPLMTLQSRRRLGKLYIDKAVEDVLSGNLDPLDVFIAFKDMADQLVKANKQIQELAIDEASKHGAKTFDHRGYKITLNNGRQTWDFKNCQGIKDLEKILKEKKAELQGLKKGVDAGAPSTFEEINGEKVLCAIDNEGQMIALPTPKYTASYITFKSTH